MIAINKMSDFWSHLNYFVNIRIFAVWFSVFQLSDMIALVLICKLT